MRQLVFSRAWRPFCTHTRFSSIFSAESKLDPYWISHVAAITKPNALALLPQLTDSNPLGFKSEGPVRSCSLLAEAKRWKAEHPTKVLLVRVGEFFEAFGLDAALLVQHAGLNPMAGRPRAGCPRPNLAAVVNALTEAGLSVAVYEEASEVARTKTFKTKKTRFLAHVVTPGMPGFVQESDILRSDSIAYTPARPFAFIAHNSLGFSVYLVHADAKQCRIYRNLTEEACVTLLETTGGLAEPLFYSSLSSRLNALLPARRVKLAVSPADVLDTLCLRITQELSLATPLAHLRVTDDSHADSHGRVSGLKPLYRSAAQALGLMHTDSQASTPSLAREILPSNAPPFALRFVQKWLLCPPSERLRDAMQALVQGFCELKLPMPDFRPVSVEKTVRLLEERKANASCFFEIKQCCAGVLGMAAASPDINRALLEISSAQSGVRIDLSTLINQLNSATIRIDQAIGSSSEISSLSSESDQLVPAAFFDANEAALLSIQLDRSKLGQTRQELETAASEAVKAGVVAVLHFDSANNLVYSKKKTAVHAIDRKGEKISGKFTSERLLRAQIAYLHEAEFLASEARRKLKELAVEISDLLPAIVLASHWCVAAAVASLHAEVKLRRGWNFASFSGKSIEVNGLCPYWLDPPPRGSATTSDVSMAEGEGPVLLTAPNMSGKSTFLRSLAAAAILGSCGFSVPARCASLTPLNHVIFVSPSGDRPADGVSAFAAEVEAMAVAIRDTSASRASLVLVDEFGRGTSSADGTALTAALLEFFARRNASVRCVFASHLHEVFEAQAAISARLVFWKMQGHALAAGTCTDSLGIETARSFGLAAEVCERAHALKLALRGTSEATSARDMQAALAEPSGSCVVETVVRKCLETLLPEASEQTMTLRADEKVPPMTQASAVVYALLLGDGGVYVGESDNFARRLGQHKRSKKEGILRVIVTPVQSKGEARLAETALINALATMAGIKLRSLADGKRKANALLVK